MVIKKIFTCNILTNGIMIDGSGHITQNASASEETNIYARQTISQCIYTENISYISQYSFINNITSVQLKLLQNIMHSFITNKQNHSINILQ